MKKINDLYVFHGNGNNYSNPASFKYNEIYKDSKIFNEITDAKRNGKFAEYTNKTAIMSDRIKDAVLNFASKNEYDLITNYTKIEATDVTEEIKKLFKEIDV